MTTRKSKKSKVEGNGTRNRVPNEVFVAAWSRATTARDVMEATGISPSGFSQKAKRLREAGVKLPKLQRATPVIDVAGLNALLK